MSASTPIPTAMRSIVLLTVGAVLALAGCQRESAPSPTASPSVTGSAPAASASAPSAEVDQFFGLYWRDGGSDLFSACGQAEVYQISAPDPLLASLRQARGKLDADTPIFVHVQASAETSLDDVMSGSAGADADADASAATATGYSNRLQVQALLEHSATLPADCQDDQRALWADQAPDDDAPPPPSKP